MKKLIATILSITIAMSLAACSGKQPGQSGQGQGQEQETTVPDIIETEVPLTEATTPSETTANLASDFVKCKFDKLTEPDEDDVIDNEVTFYVPELLIKSSYADSVNKEISSLYETYKGKFKKGVTYSYSVTSYIAYLSKDGVLSLVFIINEEDVSSGYRIYNIDTKTGEKVENARLAQIAGVSDIRKAAMDALQNYFNKLGQYELKDYKVISEKEDEDDVARIKNIEKSFSEEFLNDKMQIGLTNEGKMIFVSKAFEAGSPTFQYQLYDSDGTFLDDEDNPFWVGEREDDDKETGDKSKETTAAEPVYLKKDYLKDKVVKFKVKEDYNKKKKKWTYETYEYHFPVLLIKSSYADSINKAMDKLVKAYQKEFKLNGNPGDCGTEYIAYITKEGILSLAFIVTSENDYLEFSVYNIDVKTGEKVDNAQIAEIAGISNIRKSAMDALQAKYNKGKQFRIKNYKVVKKKGKKKNSMDKDVEKAFSEKRLNSKMKIGLTDKSKIFFISEYETGAGEFFGIYDENGKDLYYSKNPNWVGDKD